MCCLAVSIQLTVVVPSSVRELGKAKPKQARETEIVKMANALENDIHNEARRGAGAIANLWSAADKGDTVQVKVLLDRGRDVNSRNCLGCTPLLYACGSGHIDTVSKNAIFQRSNPKGFTCLLYVFICLLILFICSRIYVNILQVKLILDQPNVDVNRRNNDRLTSFMLAMQGGPLIGPTDSSWPGWNSCTTHDKLRRLMDLPATMELEMSRHDRWTALMEACNFGHRSVLELLLSVPSIDLEAMNIRGQRADEVAMSRGHEILAQLIQAKRHTREQPEELPRIRELEEQVENLKTETRNRLLQNIDHKYAELSNLRSLHEKEIESMTRNIDSLQEQLEEAMKNRLSMITRQVRIVKNAEEEIRQLKRKLDNFDRYAAASSKSSNQAPQQPPVTFNSVAISPMMSPSTGGARSMGSLNTGLSHSSNLDITLFDKDFECSVCLDDMKPPVKIFQCRNGHVMCESCKNHPEVITCPTCRIPLPGPSALMRNIPMEKLARSYFEKMDVFVSSNHRSRSRSENRSRRSSFDILMPRATSQPPSDDKCNPSKNSDW